MQTGLDAALASQVPRPKLASSIQSCGIGDKVTRAVSIWGKTVKLNDGSGMNTFNQCTVIEWRQDC